MFSLPGEVINICLDLLEVKDILRFSNACKFTKKHCDRVFWKRHVLRSDNHEKIKIMAGDIGDNIIKISDFSLNKIKILNQEDDEIYQLEDIAFEKLPAHLKFLDRRILTAFLLENTKILRVLSTTRGKPIGSSMSYITNFDLLTKILDEDKYMSGINFTICVTDYGVHFLQEQNIKISMDRKNGDISVGDVKINNVKLLDTDIFITIII